MTKPIVSQEVILIFKLVSSVIECIEKKKLPKTNFSDAVKTMELVDMIYKSVI